MTMRRSMHKVLGVIGAAAALMSPSLAQVGGPNDPYFHSGNSWLQPYADLWGLKRVGFTMRGKGQSAWDIADGAGKPVTVAIIDTGLDYLHPDLAREAIWRNPGETLNGVDDDGNGFIDDIIGWNFIDNNNDPWDFTGHGTHVAGVIAANYNNGEGVPGINRGARLMVLKALNEGGAGPSVGVVAAIYYAVDNGAKVINLSLGGEGVSKAEAEAVRYAAAHDVVVVVAAGNSAGVSDDFGLAALPEAITVAAVGVDSKRARFSNAGGSVDVAAPGVDILSLRARRTDFNLAAGVPGYRAGDAIFGPHGEYYLASGTSFAAPYVTGVASLLRGANPALTAIETARIIRQSARDIETPGVDRLSGYGLLDARAALKADPHFYVTAEISGLQVANGPNGPAVVVSGRADADQFADAHLEVGAGDNPKSWTRVSGAVEKHDTLGSLISVPAGQFSGSSVWTLRLVVRHKNGAVREARFRLNLG